MAISPIGTEKPLRILVIASSHSGALPWTSRFYDAGYKPSITQVNTVMELRNALQAKDWDVVLCNPQPPGVDAFSALNEIRNLQIDLPFLIVADHVDEETAVQAMRAGAHDYVSKEHLERLIPAVERELREARLRMERRSALETARESERRFRVLAANIPGMVFQAAKNPEGSLQFLYVSDGCLTLLEMQRQELVAAPERFFAMILAEDRESFDKAFALASERFGTLNWEGRIAMPRGDSKWINMRCSPRRMESADVILWEGIVSNITHSKEAEKATRESRKQLAELSSHLEAVIEQERKRIARDIHDVLGGLLVAMKFEVSMLAGKLAKSEEPHSQRMASLGKLVDEAIATAGRVARELRPGILEEFGLAAAIESQAQDFSQRTGIPCTVSCDDPDMYLEPGTGLALFRIYQEALTNIAKHAKAQQVTVRLIAEGEDAVLEVTDDGCGVSPADLKKPKSFGLRSIRERIQNLGGSMDIYARKEGGTRIVIRAPSLPYPFDAEDDESAADDIA